MNKMLDTTAYIASGFSVISFVEGFNAILTMISAIIGIVVGAIALVVKIKQIASDGKITDEERKELLQELEKLKKEVEDTNDKLRKN